MMLNVQRTQLFPLTSGIEDPKVRRWAENLTSLLDRNYREIGTKTGKFDDIITKSPWIDVRAYGVDPTGVADSTTAMNAATTAVNDAGGGTIYIPKGSYKLTDSLILYSNTSLWMDPEAILIRYFSGDAAVVGASIKNGTIRNATKDVANRDSNITIFNGQIYTPDSSYDGPHLLMWGVDNFRMEGTKIRQAYGPSATGTQGLFYRGDNAIFSNLNIDTISVENTPDNGNDALHIASGTNIRIDNCYIKAEDDCIALANYGYEGTSAISDVVISNCNLVSNRNNIKIAHSWDVSDLIQRVTITNCTGYQTGEGGAHIAQNVTILPEQGSADGKIQDVIIADSIFRSDAFAGYASYISNGVFVKGANNIFIDNVWVKTPNRSGFWIEDCNNVQIRGGGILSPRNPGYYSVYLGTVNDFILDGAYVDGPVDRQNIILAGVCDNHKIINNSIKEILDAFAGILTSGTVDGLIIKGNMFDKAGATGYGYQAAGTETNVLFADNDCRGVTKGVKVIADVNSGLLLRSNLGYVTENQGVGSLLNGNTTVVIAHGCAEIPTIINITRIDQTSNPHGDWWVDTIGAANFTLHAVNPGISNLDFIWEAKVRY